MSQRPYYCACFDYMTEEVIREMNKHVRHNPNFLPSIQYKREERGFIISEYEVNIYGREALVRAFETVKNAMCPSDLAWYWWEGGNMVIAANQRWVAERRRATASEVHSAAWRAAGAARGVNLRM